jgi:hypothetical protein
MPQKTVRVLAGVFFFTFLATWACECEDDRIGQTLGELEAVPDPVEFGEVPVSTVKTIDVTLTNRGTATVQLYDLYIQENENDFSLRIPPGLTLPHAIPPGNQAVFTVRYHPKAYPEEDTGIALIKSSDKSAPEYELVLLGTAVEPILLVEPVPVDFGSVRVMSTMPATLTITHTGSSPDPVRIDSLNLTDSGDDDFKLEDADDVPLTLNPGDDTKVHFAYTPQLIDDADEGTFTIESDAQSQEHMEVPLLGSSHAPAIEVSTLALNFGTVSIGADPSLPFTIKSVGTDPLSITELKLSQTGSQKFTFVPVSIDDPIDPLDQVEVWVTYIADDRGDDAGVLQISHDDPLTRPVFIQLQGRTPCPDVDVRPDFITIQIAKDSHSQSTDIRIYNVGDENLLVTGHDFVNKADNDGYFTVESSPTYPATVAPGAIPAGPYETLVIRYDHPDSTATVDDSCTITFSTDDPDEQQIVVTVVGTYSP